MVHYSSALMLFSLALGGALGFNIPIPFGNIDFTKSPDGTAQFGINSGLNIGGNGAESGLTFTSKNGSIQTQTGGGVLVGGNKFGTNSTLGVDKQQGLTADTDIQVGKNQTLHGGLGKENNFINDLVNTVQQGQKGRRNQLRQRQRM